MNRTVCVAWIAALAAHAGAQATGPAPESSTAPGAGSIREGGTGGRSQYAWLGDWKLVIGAGGEYAFESDLDDGGSVGVARAGGDISIGGEVADDLRLTFSIDGEANWYDFGGSTNLIPGDDDPWDDLYEVGIGMTGIYSIDKEWSIFGGAFVRSGFEPGADFGETIYGGGLLGVGFKITEDLSIRIGGGASTQLEDDVRFFPAIGVDWIISKQLSLRSDGLGLRLEAKLSDEFSVYLAGRFESRQFRLDKDRGSLDNGVVRDERVPISVGVVWSPCSTATVSLEGGVVAYQQYEVLNANGVERGDDETDPAAFVGGRIELKF